MIGYIQWIHKSGFRQKTVMELEQIAVLSSWQGQGVGTRLIKESLASIKSELEKGGMELKSILVSTRTDNAAQFLYKKTLNAEPVAVIRDLYSDDELLMVGCK